MSNGTHFFRVSGNVTITWCLLSRVKKAFTLPISC